MSGGDKSVSGRWPSSSSVTALQEATRNSRNPAQAGFLVSRIGVMRDARGRFRLNPARSTMLSAAGFAHLSTADFRSLGYRGPQNP